MADAETRFITACRLCGIEDPWPAAHGFAPRRIPIHIRFAIGAVKGPEAWPRIQEAFEQLVDAHPLMARHLNAMKAAWEAGEF